MKWRLGVFLILAACDPNLTRPPGAQVSCETSDDCPGLEICDDLGKLCTLPGVAISPRLNLRAEATAGEVLLQWDVPPSDFQGFVIERQSVGTSLFEVVGELPWGNPPPQFFLDAGVQLDTQYGYRIRLRSGGITLDAHPDDEIVQWSVPTPLLQASGTSTAPTTVQLNWTDPNASTTTYRVLRRGNGETDPTEITAALQPPALTFEDTTAEPDSRYFYSVAAGNDGGFSLAPELEVWTVANPPTPLSLTTQSTSTIDLSWVDTSTSETAVRIERQVGGGGFALVTDLSPDTVTFSDTGLDGNTTYDYRVSIINPGGASPPAESTERTSAHPLLNFTGLSLDASCQLTASGTATLDTAKGAALVSVGGR